MVTYTTYVIATLAAVCLTTAWPQQRVPQPKNNSEEDLDRIIMESDETAYLKTIFTYPNSRNTSTSTGSRNIQGRPLRLQDDFLLDKEDPKQHQSPRGEYPGRSLYDSDYTRRQRQHQPYSRSGSQASRRIDGEVGSNGEREGRIDKVGSNTRGNASQQQPRSHNNQTRSGGSGRVNGTSMVREGSQEGRGILDARPNGTRDDPVAAASQETMLRSRHVDNMAAERNLPRWGSNKGYVTSHLLHAQHLSLSFPSHPPFAMENNPPRWGNKKGNRIKMPNESIVFPEASREQQRQFVPKLQGDRPHCADDGDTFCTVSTKDYPIEHLSRILDQQGVVFRNFFTSDVVPEANDIAQRFDDGTLDEQPLCMSEANVVYPKVGQNKDNEWMFIVNLNEDDFKQGVRVEKCRTPDTPCAYNEGFPSGRQTKCRQKYIYRQMLAISQDGSPKPDSFKLPSCCACHTSISEAVARSGFGTSNQTPAPKRRRRRRG